MEHDDRAYLGVDDQIVRAVALRDLPSLIEGLRRALSAT